jgi:hypothetical protein
MAKNNSENINIRSIVLTGVISLIVAVSGTWIVNKLSSEKMLLEYDISSSEVFESKNGKMQISTITIINSGIKNIDDISASISINSGNISEYKVVGLHKDSYLSELKNNELSFSLKYLNPTEKFNIQLLMTNSSDSNFSPKTDIRARGVIGKQKEFDKEKGLIGTFISALLGIISVLISFLVLLKLRPNALYTKQHSDDQRDVMAYILGATGLVEYAQEVRNIPREISYWSLSDDLTEKWLHTNNKDICLEGAKALERLIDYASMANTSVMLVHTNIASLYRFAENLEKSNQFIELAANSKHEVIKKRLEILDIN